MINYNDLIKIKKMASRKNEVYLVKFENLLYYLKEYRNIEGMNRELANLERLKFLDIVPRVIEKYKNALLLSYLGDTTLYDVIVDNKMTLTTFEPILNKIINMLDNFKSQNVIQKDVNFKNYIVTKDDICAVDWEETIEEDVNYGFAKFLAFSTLYDGYNEIIVNHMINLVSDRYKIPRFLIDEAAVEILNERVERKRI